MSVLVDANDSKYWEQRAVEQIKEIHQFNLYGQEAEDRLRLSIQLLTLSLVKRGQDQKEGSG